MKDSERSVLWERHPRSLYALCIALGIWIAACLWYPLTDTDIWWHLAAAKLMLANKAFLRSDPFCIASFGAPWIDLHWGFQIIALAVWKLAGATGLVAGKVLSLIAAIGLALKPHLNKRTAPFLIPLAAFGCYHIRFWIDVRPLALTLLGLSIHYFVFIGWLRKEIKRPWLLMIPVQIFLVNVQGLYPLGSILVSLMLAGEFWSRARDGKARRELRTMALTALALWAAGFVNPYGWAGFKLPLALFGRITPVASNIFSSEIAENQPLLTLARQDFPSFIPFALLGLAVLFTFEQARRKISPGHVFLFGAFGLLGVMAQRNLPITFLAGLMAAGRNLQVAWGVAASQASMEQDGKPRAEPRSSEKRASRDKRAGLSMGSGWAAFAVIVLINTPKIVQAWAFELPGRLETPFRFPTGAVDYLQAHPIEGNIFNELRYGGYLEYRLYPEKLSFVDGRMIVRSAEFYESFLRAVDHPETFPEYRTRYGITHVLLPISEDPRFLPLLGYLLRSGEWNLLFCDGSGALLAQRAFAQGESVGDSGLAAQARDAKGSGLSLDSLPVDHPIMKALRNRFGANPRLEALAKTYLAELLLEANKERAVPALLEGIPGTRAAEDRARALAALSQSPVKE